MDLNCQNFLIENNLRRQCIERAIIDECTWMDIAFNVCLCFHIQRSINKKSNSRATTLATCFFYRRMYIIYIYIFVYKRYIERISNVMAICFVYICTMFVFLFVWHSTIIDTVKLAYRITLRVRTLTRLRDINSNQLTY